MEVHEDECGFFIVLFEMLMFCPTCANILAVEEGPNCLRFSCSTCPYVHNITKRIENRTYPKLKEVTVVDDDATIDQYCII